MFQTAFLYIIILPLFIYTHCHQKQHIEIIKLFNFSINFPLLIHKMAFFVISVLTVLHKSPIFFKGLS